MNCLDPLKITHPRRRSAKWREYLKTLSSEGRFYEESSTPMKLWVPCGVCPTCRKRRSSEWRLRLLDEMKYGVGYKRATFVTLTIDNAHYYGFRTDVASYIRSFWDKYRHVFRNYDGPKDSRGRALIPKHFFITELGEKKGRLHLHGIIFDSVFYIPRVAGAKPVKFVKGRPVYKNQLQMADRIRKCWPYGKEIFVGDECNLATASYILKYMVGETKNGQPKKLYDPYFYPHVFVSPGLGRMYVDSVGRDFLRSVYLNRRPAIIDVCGYKYNIPRYYRNVALDALEIRRLSDSLVSPENHDCLPLPNIAFGRTFSCDDDYLSYCAGVMRSLGFQPRKARLSMHLNSNRLFDNERIINPPPRYTLLVEEQPRQLYLNLYSYG